MPRPFDETDVTASHSALFIDPDPESNSLNCAFFKLNGWDVDCTADGREALAKALTAHIDVFVMETRLLGIDGLELCRILRRDRATATVPILVVTRRCSTPSDVEEIQIAGADSILIKPCPPGSVFAEALRLVSNLALTSRRRVSRPADNRPPAPRSLTLTARHHRGPTTSPPLVPPAARCPACDSVMAYETSEIGGVSAKHPEQWDYFTCASGCGRFQYRQRTRTVRRAG
jgi:CheY-like chemotaxis protein